MFYVGALLSIHSTPPFKIHPMAMLVYRKIKNACLIDRMSSFQQVKLLKTFSVTFLD